MRRKDREVTDLSEIKQIVEDCQVVRLGIQGEVYPYVVPVNFGYQWQDSQLTLFIHGARQGLKLDLIKNNPKVGLEMDLEGDLITSEEAGQKSYSFSYCSLMGQGDAEILNDLAEKRAALDLIIAHYAKTVEGEVIPERMVQGTAVIKIEVQNYSAKRHAKA